MKIEVEGLHNGIKKKNIKLTRNLLINETRELANQNSFSLDPNKVIVISVDI